MESLLRARVSTPSVVAAGGELQRKVTMEEVKGMQRDLVVQLWGVSGPLSKWESAAAVI